MAGVTLKLIKGGDKLLAECAKFKKDYDDTMRLAQQLGISVIVHAATTGDTRPMDVFHDGLNETHQGMFRNFLRIVNKQHNDTTACIRFADKKFQMMKDTADQRETLAKLCETVLLNPPEYVETDPATHAPDGSAYKPWIERNAVGDTFVLMDDGKFESQLKALLSRAEGKSENVNSTVDKDFTKKLAEVVDFVKARNDQKRATGEMKATRQKAA